MYTLVAYTHNYVFLLICCYSPFWTGTSNPKLAPMPEANSTEHSIPLQLVQFSRSHAQTARDPTNQLGHISSCLVRGYWVTTNIMHVGVTTKAVAATHSHDTQRAIHFKQRRRKIGRCLPSFNMERRSFVNAIKVPLWGRQRGLTAILKLN